MKLVYKNELPNAQVDMSCTSNRMCKKEYHPTDSNLA